MWCNGLWCCLLPYKALSSEAIACLAGFIHFVPSVGLAKRSTTMLLSNVSWNVRVLGFHNNFKVLKSGRKKFWTVFLTVESFHENPRWNCSIKIHHYQLLFNSQPSQGELTTSFLSNPASISETKGWPKNS